MEKVLRCLTPLAVAALVAATGCSSIPVQTRKDSDVPTYPPKKDPAKVRILREAPTRPNVKLGEITAEPQSTSIPVSEIDAKLQKAGAKLGADAVVIVVETTFTEAATTNKWWQGSVNPDIGEIYVGVPIRYTGQQATGMAQVP